MALPFWIPYPESCTYTPQMRGSSPLFLQGIARPSGHFEISWAPGAAIFFGQDPKKMGAQSPTLGKGDKFLNFPVDKR